MALLQSVPQMAKLTINSLFCRTPPRRSRPAKPTYERPPSPQIQKKDKGKAIMTSASSPSFYDYIPCYKQKICIVESRDKERSLKEIIPLYLTQQLEYPGDAPKTRRWYERVLEETQSVAIQHKIRDAQNFAFSTINIHRVLTPSEWGSDIKKPRFFKDSSVFPRAFNYCDYQQAWEKELNYQNNQRSHSWFLAPKLIKDFDLEEFPVWFQYWFLKFGLSKHNLPKGLDSTYKNFCETYSLLSQPQLLFSFAFLYSIPWILAWHITLEPLADFNGLGMSKQFTNKWWAKFSIQHILDDWTAEKIIEYGQPKYPKAQTQVQAHKVLKELDPALIRQYLKDIEAEETTNLSEEEDDPFQDSQFP